MALSIDELKILIQNDEHRQLELKKTTGELKDGMHTACAFLNTEGGWLFFGVAPTSLKILGFGRKTNHGSLQKKRCRSTYMVYRWRFCCVHQG